jgi:hypothetical protein
MDKLKSQSKQTPLYFNLNLINTMLSLTYFPMELPRACMRE